MWKPTLLAVTVALACGCAHQSEEAAAAESDRTRAPGVKMREHTTTQVQPAAPAGPKAKAPDDLVSRMGRDLADRLKVKVAEIQVLSLEPVVWDDGALGCPQPGQSYVMAQTPGLRVLFQHLGKTYQYHASEQGAFVYCENPATPARGLDRQ